MKIYLAGQIEATKKNCHRMRGKECPFRDDENGGGCKSECDDWRTSIIGGAAVRNSKFGSSDNSFTEAVYPVVENAVFRCHDYIGPFYSGHHGVNIDAGAEGNVHQQYGADFVGNEPDNIFYATAMAQDIHRRDMKAIHEADIVFGWIESTECYGMLYELGYAKALQNVAGRPLVGVGYHHGHELGALWFALSGVIAVSRSSDPAEALKEILTGFGVDAGGVK